MATAWSHGVSSGDFSHHITSQYRVTNQPRCQIFYGKRAAEQCLAFHNIYLSAELDSEKQQPLKTLFVGAIYMQIRRALLVDVADDW